MKKTDLAWIAGFVGGDGCITVSASNNKNPLPGWAPYLTITNTNKKLLKQIATELGVVKYWLGDHDPNRSKRWKRCFRLVYSGPHALQAIKLLLPWLRSDKKRVAELVLSVPKRRPCWRNQKLDLKGFAKQKKIVDKIRKLNKRGR